MNGTSRVSPRAWLAALTIGVCLAMLGIVVSTELAARQTAFDVAQRDAENLAGSLSVQASDTFEAIDAVMRLVADRVAVAGKDPIERVRLRDSLAAVVTTMPRLHGLTVYDARGRFLVNDLSASRGWLPSVADRPYFRYHATHQVPNAYISGPARSRVDGTWVLFETRRLNDAAGNFVGVVVGTVDVRYFESLFAPVDVGSLGSIAILTDDGTLIARKPRKPYGSSLHDWAIFGDPLRYEAAGTYLRDSATDGVLRLTAFVRLGHFPVILTVAFAQSQYLAPWYARARWETIVLIGMLLIIAALAAGLLRQIDDIKRGEAQSARLALLDGLTGIANRRQFDRAIERDWHRSIREQAPLSLLMIDVDNFKAYNDANGHQHGDDVLVQIARSIADNIVRSSDLAARYGGEEFAVILPSTDMERATVVAERVRRSVVALGIPHAASSCGVITISVGIASALPTGADGWHEFVRVADEALYVAKGAGRNQSALGTYQPARAH